MVCPVEWSNEIAAEVASKSRGGILQVRCARHLLAPVALRYTPCARPRRNTPFLMNPIMGLIPSTTKEPY